MRFSTLIMQDLNCFEDFSLKSCYFHRPIYQVTLNSPSHDQQTLLQAVEVCIDSDRYYSLITPHHLSKVV